MSDTHDDQSKVELKAGMRDQLAEKRRMIEELEQQLAQHRADEASITTQVLSM